MKLFTLSDLELKKMEGKKIKIWSEKAAYVRWNTTIWEPKTSILHISIHTCFLTIAAPLAC